MIESFDWYYILNMIGTIAFATTAVLAVVPKGIDLFGASIMGIITAVGGGTIRDVILGVPVFWSTDLNYIWVALISSIFVFYAHKIMDKKYVYNFMLYLDGLGVSIFVIAGVKETIGLGFALPIGPVILGLITGIGGGLIRDVLVGNTNLLMKKELYAVPLVFGASLYLVLIHFFPESQNNITIFCTLLIFIIRLLAIVWKLTVPNWMLLK